MSLFRKNTPPDKPEPVITRGATWLHRNARLKWEVGGERIELAMRESETSHSFHETRLTLDEAEALLGALSVAIQEARKP